MKQCVAVIFGGVSTEYLISLRSAANIIAGLRQAGYDLVLIGITPTGEWRRFEGRDEDIPADHWQESAILPPAENQLAASPADWFIQLCGRRPDCIFPAVHGVNCEDGVLQGLLTMLNIPYVGSGVLASAAAMDKVLTKKILSEAGIPVCPFVSVRRHELADQRDQVVDLIETRLGYPCFLKPSNGGSSIGTHRADHRSELLDALDDVSRFDREILIEPFINAREVEVAVLGNTSAEAGPLGEIITNGVQYYDYETKYMNEEGALVQIPADLPDDQAEQIRQIAFQAYHALGCAGLARVDFFIDRKTGTLYLNEINNLPGFTAISVYPKSWHLAGLPLPDLVDRLCRLAVEEFAATRRELA